MYKYSIVRMYRTTELQARSMMQRRGRCTVWSHGQDRVMLHDVTIWDPAPTPTKQEKAMETFIKLVRSCHSLQQAKNPYEQ
jgi:hypothetical protein